MVSFSLFSLLLSFSKAFYSLILIPRSLSVGAKKGQIASYWAVVLYVISLSKQASRIFKKGKLCNKTPQSTL